MLLGVVLALYLYPRLSSSDVRFHEFALFMGTAMSVTAFPVLARILRERQLQDTRVGTVAIACAAVDDVTAWCLLAGIVALVRVSEHALPIPWMLVGLVCVRRGSRPAAPVRTRRLPGQLQQARRAHRGHGRAPAHGGDGRVGIHRVAGPAPAVRRLLHRCDAAEDARPSCAAVTARFELVATTLLLPIFFALTGLRTEIGLVSGGPMWFYCGLILALADHRQAVRVGAGGVDVGPADARRHRRSAC